MKAFWSFVGTTVLVVCILLAALLVAFGGVAGSFVGAPESKMVPIAINWNAAPQSRTVYLVENVNGKWDESLRSAIRYVDGNTGRTTIRIVRHCKTGSKCIRVGFGRVTGHAGWTSCRNRVCAIKVDKRYAYRGRLLAHELGHAYGLKHSSRHDNLMYAPLVWHGKPVPYRFTSAQKAILRQR